MPAAAKNAPTLGEPPHAGRALKGHLHGETVPKTARTKATPAAPPVAPLTARTANPRSKTFGRFGMRIFRPEVMANAHWHGHLEANFIRHGRMRYLVDGAPLVIEPGMLVLFWAGIPHQTVAIEPLDGDEPPELCNIYLPLDAFLFMPGISRLQVAMLSGGMAAVPRELCDWGRLERWYGDYRRNNPERTDIVKSELGLMFRRLLLSPLTFLRPPAGEGKDTHALASTHVRHVVTMVHHVLNNLTEPLTCTGVAEVTGLHPNYALALFTRTLQISLKQFIIRMRLLRSRALLVESDLPISSVALDCGFNSMTQFYKHFSTAYGTTPQGLRAAIVPSRRR